MQFRAHRVTTSKSFHSELSKVGDPCHSKLATGINALLVQALIHLSSVSSWVSISVFVLCISTRREHRGCSRSNEPLPAFCIVGDVYVLSHTIDNSMVQNIQKYVIILQFLCCHCYLLTKLSLTSCFFLLFF